MTEKWDAKAQPPESTSIDEKMQWLVNHVVAFQRAHPEVPQGDYYALRNSDQKKLLHAYSRARGEAMRAQK